MNEYQKEIYSSLSDESKRRLMRKQTKAYFNKRRRDEQIKQTKEKVKNSIHITFSIIYNLIACWYTLLIFSIFFGFRIPYLQPYAVWLWAHNGFYAASHGLEFGRILGGEYVSSSNTWAVYMYMMGYIPGRMLFLLKMLSPFRIMGIGIH